MFGTNAGCESVLVFVSLPSGVYEPLAMYDVKPTAKFVPSATGIPPGLNTIADGLSFEAAVAPPRPVTAASCSLMLNAPADATAEEPSVAAKRILEMLFVFMVTYLLLW